jgi:hypothetical protein
MFGFGNKNKITDEMAAWLAHPNEFGVRPKSVHHKRTYRCRLTSQGEVAIHLVEYVMPNGLIGRGFVNGSLTWSFIGDEVNAIDDDNLLLAYCGWSWLFPAMQTGHVQTTFSSDAEAEYVAQKREEGVGDVVITNRYKIGTSELFEFTGRLEGKPVKGAGNAGGEVRFEAGDPCMRLPSIYFLLGGQVLQGVQ